MTDVTPIEFAETSLDAIATHTGRVAVIVPPDAKLDPAARRINKLTRGALKRLIDSKGFADLKPGQLASLAFPTGLAAEALDVVCLPRGASVTDCRKAGAALAQRRGKSDLLLMAGALRRVAQTAYGIAMRDYGFDAHKTGADARAGKVLIHCAKPDEARAAAEPLLAVAEGAFMTRDLTNEPANVLTTTEFARRLKEMESLGLKVEVLDEKDLEKLGMRTLLSVGQGSASPTHVVVMHWQGGEKDAAPLALVGKGVVFDTGGISLKPSLGMEEMTMDMGGAAVVAGVMRTLARRRARANVVGLVGIVENMPSGTATRPGDVIRTMKGDTVEINNTDAEGRLLLCDVMWYAQDRFKPAAMIDLATLTGAIIVGLGHENAGVFSNNDALCDAFLSAAKAEGEGAWRMPLGAPYAEMLKSRIADLKNSGGRPAGSITAAEFLRRFVKDDCPWIHLDIAGVASVKTDTMLAPKGATGWGVAALNRLIGERYETE